MLGNERTNSEPSGTAELVETNKKWSIRKIQSKFHEIRGLSKYLLECFKRRVR